MTDALVAVRTSLAERLAALRGSDAAALPDSLLDVAVRPAEPGLYVLRPVDWEALREDEALARRPVPWWARPWPSGLALARALAAARRQRARACSSSAAASRCPASSTARAGAAVLATDGSTDAVVFAAHNLALNGLAGDTAHGGLGRARRCARGPRAVRRRPGRRRLLHAGQRRRRAAAPAAACSRPAASLRLADPGRPARATSWPAPAAASRSRRSTTATSPCTRSGSSDHPGRRRGRPVHRAAGGGTGRAPGDRAPVPPAEQAQGPALRPCGARGEDAVPSRLGELLPTPGTPPSCAGPAAAPAARRPRGARRRRGRRPRRRPASARGRAASPPRAGARARRDAGTTRPRPSPRCRRGRARRRPRRAASGCPAAGRGGRAGARPPAGGAARSR